MIRYLKYIIMLPVGNAGSPLASQISPGRTIGLSTFLYRSRLCLVVFIPLRFDAIGTFKKLSIMKNAAMHFS